MLLDAFTALKKKMPEQEAIVFYPDESILTILKSELERRPEVAGAISLVEKECRAGARAVLTSSGTMSLSCALAGIPGVIAYRANWFTYVIGRMILKIPYLGICNLLLEKPMYPEYIQDRATPETLVREMLDCLKSPERLEQTQADASRLREKLLAPSTLSVDAWLERHLPGQSSE